MQTGVTDSECCLVNKGGGGGGYEQVTPINSSHYRPRPESLSA